MSKYLMLSLTIALLGGGSSAVMAQQTSRDSARQVVMREQKPGLLAKAKVSADSATRLASAKLPAGKIVREQIREDDGKLVYAFVFRNTEKQGVDVVRVDANDGTVSDARHMNRSGRGKHRQGDSTSTKSSS